MEPQELEVILERLGVKDLMINSHKRLVELEKKKPDEMTPEEKKEHSNVLMTLVSIRTTVKHEYPFINIIKFWNALFKLSGTP